MRLPYKWDIRLYDYHCQYNPIELIWAQIKNKVVELNNTFKIMDVEKLVNEVIDSGTVEDWKRCLEHCEELKHSDFIKEGLRDEILEPIIMTINPDESTDESDDDEDF